MSFAENRRILFRSETAVTHINYGQRLLLRSETTGAKTNTRFYKVREVGPKLLLSTSAPVPLRPYDLALHERECQETATRKAVSLKKLKREK